jgi:heme a synthase
MASTSKRLATFAWLTLAYNLGVILWGAYVRASGSGAGCGEHWPLCNGVASPRDPSTATLIEFSHRLTSGLALIAVVVLLVWVWRVCAPGHPARRGAAWTVFFMLTEAGVGAGLVLFQLVADNASMARAMFMAVHLLNTFVLLSALTLTAWWLSGGAPLDVLRHRGAALVFGGVALGMLVVGASGAVAALGDTLFPHNSLSEALQADLSPTSHVLIRLRFLHPIFAILVGATLMVGASALAIRSGKSGWRLAVGVVVLAGLQLALGFLNVVLLAPTWMQMIHLLVADLLWVTFVLLGAATLSARREGLAYSVSGTPEGPRFIASAGLDSSSRTRV